jgi:L-alanine-DL-glutamate epimerase-like enolase superfamily enzyme
MVIQEIVLRQLRLPLAKPYRVSFRTYTEFEPIVVEVRDTDGNAGWGEAYIPAGSTAETAEGAWQYCREVAGRLLGMSIAKAKSRVDQDVGDAPFACCAVLTALAVLERHPALEVKAEARIPLLVPVAGTRQADIEAEVDMRLAQGYRTLKGKVGWQVDDDLARVAMIQAAARGRARITLDANRGYDRTQGCQFASSLDPEGIDLFEQPCEADEWDANSAVAAVSTVPLMLDESIRTDADIERAAGIDGVKLVKLKLKRVGGVDRAIRAMTLARQRGLDICLGDGVATELMCWIEACVSRGFLKRAGDMNGFLKPTVRLLANPLPFEEGNIVLRPGYWPEIDRAALRAHESRSERFASSVVAESP